MTKQQRIIHKAYKNGDNISLTDIAYKDKYHIDKIIYGRFWRIKRLINEIHKR